MTAVVLERGLTGRGHSPSVGSDAIAELVTLSLHQRDATIDERERLALRLESLADRAAVTLLTCHRVEVIAVITARGDPRAWLAERIGADAVLGSLQARRGPHALRHLFELALGLDSAVIGERQILGQLRRAYDDARARRALHPLVAASIQRALHLGREVRASTALGASARSVGSLAVDAALASLPDTPSATMVVIGAGEVGSLAIRALARRVRRTIVVNRDLAKAQELAARYGGHALPLEEVSAALDLADVAIAAADTRGRVLTAEVIGRRLARGPLTLVDIAVPRSVSADARDLPRLRYRTVDDLVAAAQPESAAVSAARRRAALESAGFAREWRARAAGPVITTLRERGEERRRRELGRALRKLGHLSDRDRRVVDDLSRALVGAVVHGATVIARDEPGRADALRDLFSHAR